MDFDKLDPDFFARAGAYTPHIYRDVYPSINPTNPALSQANKVAIITGATGGIGKGITNAFALAGARGVVLVGRQAEKLTDLASVLKKEYSSLEVLTVPTNVSDPGEVDALFAAVSSKFGTADVLVNSAGVVSTPTPISQGDPGTWWRDFEINAKGTYLMTRGFLRLVGNDSGKKSTIVNVSSGAATNIIPGMSSYSISKVAVNRLTEYLAAENGNVVSVTLDPGTVDTDMVLGKQITPPFSSSPSSPPSHTQSLSTPPSTVPPQPSNPH
jgi:NAD(P)-dependent dehydrogenase (short-subunit alcohol dehydrogenase family)